MNPKKMYSSNQLREIHGEEVDIIGGSTHKTFRDSEEHHVLPVHSGNSSFQKVGVLGHGEEEEGTKVRKMEKLPPYGYSELWKALLVEFVACVVGMLIDNYAKGNFADAMIGTLTMLVMLYPVSGANQNMCMSWALWYYEEEFVKVHIIRRYTYMILIQPLGVFVGQMLSWGVVGPDILYIKPKDTHPAQIAFCEFFFTGALIFGALHLIVSRYTRPSDLGVNFILFICVVYYIGKAGSTISGGSYNPTKYLINQAIAYCRGIEPNAFKNWYCYIFPQWIGCITFTLIFQHFFNPTYYRLMSMKMKWEDKFFPAYYDTKP